ncbi:hypothetical protein JTE90_021015 [Oedothorax gibbosus]|uniref:Uncharacterized protein n=1 Tax=Oedothorax gibbosus TaxID=931172 RepID=A0AAV6TFH1_9ARAC|nr:hypothetical protein JTE90_021015 [Oedothorax gibbosus]
MQTIYVLGQLVVPGSTRRCAQNYCSRNGWEHSSELYGFPFTGSPVDVSPDRLLHLHSSFACLFFHSLGSAPPALLAVRHPSPGHCPGGPSSLTARVRASLVLSCLVLLESGLSLCPVLSAPSTPLL